MNIKYNLSAYFILPSIGIRMSELEEHGLLVNSYLFKAQSDIDLTDCCFLKLHFQEYLDKNMKIDSMLRRNKQFHSSYNQNFNDVIYIFLFPVKFLPDIHLIIAGKYSQVSDEYKETFFQMWDTDQQGEKSPTFYNQVFNKDEDLRIWQENKYGIDLSEEPEYFSRVDIEKETLE